MSNYYLFVNHSAREIVHSSGALPDWSRLAYLMLPARRVGEEMRGRWSGGVARGDRDDLDLAGTIEACPRTAVVGDLDVGLEELEYLDITAALAVEMASGVRERLRQEFGV